MADLSTLDAASPVGSEPLAQADDRIRETRDATKTSFGGTDLGTGAQASEHYLKGFHKFPSGNQAARPAAGNAGRLYINTGDTRLERDTGAAWALINAVGLSPAYTAGALVLTTSFQDAQSVSVDIPTGARLVLLGGFTINVSLAVAAIQAQFTVAGVAVDPPAFYTTDTSGAVSPVLIGYAAAPTPGTVTVALQAKLPSAATQSIIRRLLMVLVL